MQALAEVRRKLEAGDLASALRDLESLLERVPDNVDALYLQAVVLRYANEPSAALASLQKLKLLAPMHSRAHQEEGHLLSDQGRVDAALQAYARALSLNPALQASLTESIKLLHASSRERSAVQLTAQLEALLALPKTLRDVIELLAQNKLLKAEALCRYYLQQHPDDVEGMRLLADIGVRLGVLEDAEFLLESAAAFAPDNLNVRMDYIQVLRKRQKFEAALHQSRLLLEAHPDNLQVKSLCAIEHMQTGDYNHAMTLLDEVLERVPGDPHTLVTYGHALKTSGRADAAVARYQTAISSQPQHGEAYYSLANLKTYRFTEQEVVQMSAVESDANLGFMDRIYLNFALAKAHEDQGDFARAFDHYVQGNALKKAHSRYDAARMHEEIVTIRQLCDETFFADRPAFGHSAPDPIFILGLPRAGSTLLEQILSSHSQVDGTLELPNILSLSQHLRRRDGDGYPQVLHTLTADECAGFGADYLADTRIHRGSAPHFVDKMPNNFRHIGLIKLILPNAKIIDARREPMACCFSGFKQLFAEGQEFSYDLADIGQYYRDYLELMSHWDAVLPNFVLRVQHEAVVADLESEVRRLLDFCGLPFEDACLRFFETERDVRTPSSEQVRQPIFTEGLTQWRNFEPWLEPLKAALRGAPHD